MVKNILALLGVGVVGVAGFVCGVIGTAITYGNNGCVNKGTSLGEITIELAEAFKSEKSEPHGELS